MENIRIFLTAKGLYSELAARFQELCTQSLVSVHDIDDQAIKALMKMKFEDACVVVDRFAACDLQLIRNKSAYLCSLVTSFKRHSEQSRRRENDQTVQTITPSQCSKFTCAETLNGDEAMRSSARCSSANTLTTANHHQTMESCIESKNRIELLLKRTGYSLNITLGQRKFGGPPPDWNGPAPLTCDCQVFVGKIPPELLEDELIPLFETCGKIYSMRLMMDPSTELSRGYAFLCYASNKGAQQCIDKYNNYEIRPDYRLEICRSSPNCRLFVSPIPRQMSKEEIFYNFSRKTDNLLDVTIHAEEDCYDRNRGFAFLDYKDHLSASQAKRLFDNCTTAIWDDIIYAEWASREQTSDCKAPSKVNMIYCYNLSSNITRANLSEIFHQYGEIVQIRKSFDSAMLFFVDQKSAWDAVAGVNGKEINGCTMKVTLGIPSHNKRKMESRDNVGLQQVSYRDDISRRGMLTASSRGYDGGNAVRSLVSPPGYRRSTASYNTAEQLVSRNGNDYGVDFNSALVTEGSDPYQFANHRRFSYEFDNAYKCRINSAEANDGRRIHNSVCEYEPYDSYQSYGCSPNVYEYDYSNKRSRPHYCRNNSDRADFECNFARFITSDNSQSMQNDRRMAYNRNRISSPVIRSQERFMRNRLSDRRVFRQEDGSLTTRRFAFRATNRSPSVRREYNNNAIARRRSFPSRHDRIPGHANLYLERRMNDTCDIATNRDNMNTDWRPSKSSRISDKDDNLMPLTKHWHFNH